MSLKARINFPALLDPIVFRCDDGSGGIENYIQIDGSEGRTLFNKHIRVNDSVQIQVGGSADLQIYHNSADTWFDNYTGNINFRNRADDGDIIFYSDDGSGGHAEYFRIDGGSTLNVFSKSTWYGDGVKAMFGNSTDLQIYHDGSNSHIDDTGTGNLVLRGNGAVSIQKYTGENLAMFNADGSVDLYYDDSKKFETTSTGIEVTGGTQSTFFTSDGGRGFKQDSDAFVSTYSNGADANNANDIGSSSNKWRDAYFAGVINTGTISSGAITTSGLLTSTLGINQSTLPDTPSEHVITLNPPTTTGHYGGGISWSEGTNTAASLGVYDDGTGGALGMYFATGNNTSVNQRLTIDSVATTKISSDGGNAAGTVLEMHFPNNNTSDVCSTINFTNNVGGYAAIETGTDGANNSGYIAFKTDNAGTAGERMRIKSDGSILHQGPTGGGTNTFQTWQYGTDSNYSLNLKQNVGSGIVKHIFDVVNGGLSYSNMLVLDRGNVGIGNISPQQRLTVGDGSGSEIISIYAGNSNASAVHFTDTNTSTDYQGFVSYNHSSDALRFGTAETERMRIDSSGNVGINCTSTGAKLEIKGGGYNSIRIGSNQTANTNKQSGISMNNYEGNGTSIIQTFCQNNSNAIYYGSADGGFRGVQKHYFMVNDDSDATTGHTQAMMIDADANVLINTTLTNVYTNTTANQGGVSIMKTAGGSRLDVARDGSCYTANRPSTTGIIHDFRQAGVQVGTITITSSATAYNTSSDYRLKEDLQDFAGLDMISKIPVYDFKWKSDESRSYGVMAHELQEVLPQAVTGEKDAEEMQSVDYSKIVPLLVKSIQELKAEIDRCKQNKCECKN